MATRQTNGRKSQQRRGKPPSSPQEWEDRLIGLSFELAEQQLIDGTASAQVQTHYLKLGSSRERLEQMRLAMEVELLEEKKEALAAEQRIEDLYQGVIDAMKSYRGFDPDVMHDDDPYD